MPRTTDVNCAVESLLDREVRKLEALVGCDVLAYIGAIDDHTDSTFRMILEARKSKRPKLAIILQTHGGCIEGTERVVEAVRNYYVEVDFYIPDHAMSAGTVLAMSGDAIHMNYFSRLGPIDPQIKPPGREDWVPALGYLARYEMLLEKDRRNALTTVKAAILLRNFDQGDLYLFQQARELTITLFSRWLAHYKFKDWVVTESRGLPVGPAERQQRAAEIAAALNDTNRWHSHARYLSMQPLQDELNC